MYSKTSEYLYSDRRLRSSSKTSATRREIGLVDSLCNAAYLFDLSTSNDVSNEGKREKSQTIGSSSKLTFASKLFVII